MSDCADVISDCGSAVAAFGGCDGAAAKYISANCEATCGLCQKYNDDPKCKSAGVVQGWILRHILGTGWYPPRPYHWCHDSIDPLSNEQPYLTIPTFQTAVSNYPSYFKS